MPLLSPSLAEVEVAYSFLNKDVKIIAITGSNGKTTTTTMIYNILKKAGLKVHLGGNIGYPVSSLVGKTKKGDILCLEISDHQLVDMYEFKSDISILTNLYEVHLDFHENYGVYKNMKKKIFIILASCILIVVVSICIFKYYHPTHFAYNDRFIIGNTQEKIIEKYINEPEKLFDYIKGAKTPVYKIKNANWEEIEI